MYSIYFFVQKAFKLFQYKYPLFCLTKNTCTFTKKKRRQTVKIAFSVHFVTIKAVQTLNKRMAPKLIEFQKASF